MNVAQHAALTKMVDAILACDSAPPDIQLRAENLRSLLAGAPLGAIGQSADRLRAENDRLEADLKRSHWRHVFSRGSI